MRTRVLVLPALLAFGSGCLLDDHVWSIAGYGDSITNQPNEWCGLIDTIPPETPWACEIHAVAGERAAQGVERLLEDLEQGLIESHYVVLAWGANDVGIDTIQKLLPDLLEGIQAVRDAGKIPVLWNITPRWLPIGGRPEEPDLLRNREIQNVNRVLELVASLYKLPIVDGYSALEGRPDLFVDPVHPSRGDNGGQAVLAVAVQVSVYAWELTNAHAY